MKKAKLAAGALAVCLLASTLSACSGNSTATSTGPASSDGGKTVVNVVLAGGGFWETPMAAIEQDYEAKNPHIDLNIQILGYDQLLQTVEVKLGAKSDEFDIVAVDAPLVAAYTNRGYLQPLDQWIPPQDQDLFIESSKTSSLWDGKFMASPMENSCMLLFYNQALLDEAGVELNLAPDEHITWEKMVEVSNQVLGKLDPEHNKGYSGIGLEQVSRPYQVLPLANTLGEVGIGADGFTVDGVLNTEGWVKAMDFYKSLFESGISPRGIKAEEMGPQFYAGKMVFYIGGPWNYFTASGTEGFSFGYSLFPTFAGYEDKTATPTGSWHLGISNFSKQPEEAAKFIRYITIEDGNALWLSESKDVPALKAALQATIDNPDAMEISRLAAMDVYNTGFPRPVSPGYTEWESVMTTTFEDIRNGSDSKTSLDNAVEQIDHLFQKYKD